MIQERIIELMAYLKLTAGALAERIGVQPSSVSHILSGRNKPSLDFVNKLLVCFPQVNYDWLVNGRGSMLKNVAETGEVADLFSFSEQGGSTSVETQSEIVEESPRRVVARKAKTINKPNRGKEPEEGIGEHKARSERKISKVILFYDDGSFEEFSPK